jgi:predicted metalloprotease
MDGPLPTCGGDPVTEDVAEFNIFFCIDDNYVAWDEELLSVVHEQIGDFGVAALLSAQWSTSAQIQSGLSEETPETALQRDCYAGAWTGNVYLFTVGGIDASGREPFFTLSPGDLDEVIQAFIAFSVPAGSEEAELYGTAFERVAAFRDGFLDGPAACAAMTE